MSDITGKYTNAVTFTIGLGSLANSATRVAGRESTAIDFSSLLHLDALVSGHITSGTTPTANTYIDIWVYGCKDETPTYPTLVTSGITGTDANSTAVTEAVRNNALRLGATIHVDTNTSNRQYDFTPFSVGRLFGGPVPRFWGLWVSNGSGVALHATAGNHVLKYQGIKRQF